MANLSSVVTQTIANTTAGVNLITAANSASLWTASTISVSTSTLAAELPLGPSVASAIKFALVASPGSAYVDFDCPVALLNTKLKIQWFSRSSGGFTATITASMASYASASDRSTNTNPTTVTLRDTNVAGLATQFNTSFDTTSQVYYRLTLSFTAQASAWYSISQFEIGPGEIIQAGAIGPIESTNSFVVGATTTPPTPGSGTTYYRETVREGEYAIIRWEVNQSSPGSAGSGDYLLPLPSGLTINFAKVNPTAAATTGVVGTAYLQTQSIYLTGVARVVSSSTNTVRIDVGEATQVVTTWGAGYGGFNGATCKVGIIARLPISEWAGSGTVNLGASAQVEYAYNTSTATGTGDTSSFAYGQQGAQIQNITTDINRRVRFQNAIQPDDVITVEVSEDRIKWYPINLPFRNSGASYGITPWTLQNATGYGMGRITQVSSTDIDVQFGTYSAATGATYAAAGQAWSAGGGSAYWRVRKAKATAPVGFAAATATELGLVKLSQLSGGSGSGEVNAVANPSAASDTTGWTNATRVTSNSPLDPVVTTAFSIANTAAAESSTSGGYYSITTLPASLRSTKLKVEFWFTTPATDVYRVSVYAGSTRLPLSSDSAGATSLPAGTTAKFVASFDSTTATAYSVNITRTSGTTGACLVTGVIVGPGQIVQGAAISEWQSYTPTVSNLGGGSISSIGARWRRVGSSMQVICGFVTTGTGSGASNVTVSLPSGYNIDSTALPAVTLLNGRNKLGSYTRFNGTTYVDDSGVIPGSATTVCFIEPGTANTLTGADFAAATELSFDAMIPIAEWAGNGTVALTAGSQVEYAYNTSGITAAGASDTTSFGYGPIGAAIGSINSTTGANNTTTMRVRFQTPVAVDDVITVETDCGLSSSKWVSIDKVGIAGGLYQGTSFYGVYCRPVTGSETDVDVGFGNRGAQPNNATYAGDGQAWSTVSTWRWRVRKARASLPAGIGTATQDGLGLVKLSQISGVKNYVASTSTATGWFNIGDLDLSTTTTAAELPREYTTKSAIKITADADTQSTADYVYIDFNLDDVDLNRKLSLRWSQKVIGTYTAGQLAAVITTQADRTTVLHTPQVTSIPASDGDFVTSFDSGSTATLSLVIRATADMTTGGGIAISDVEVGPGRIEQGAAIGEWQSYTPTLTNGGTTSANVGRWRRVGTVMEIETYQAFTGAGAAGTFSIAIPSGYSIDTTALPVSQQNVAAVLGTAQYYNGSVYAILQTSYITNTSPNGVVFYAQGSSGLFQGNALANNYVWGMRVSIPIAEWAGSGTVNLGPGAQVEYAFNTDVTSTGNPSSNGAVASSASGPQGVVFASAWAAGTNYQRRVRFQSPIQNDDVITLECLDPTNNVWTALENRLGAWVNTTGTYQYGANVYSPSGGANTDIEVVFTNGGYAIPTAFGTATGSAWSALNGGGFRWRVRRAKASAPVGFGMAGIDGSAGLYKAGQSPGLTTGAAIGTGYVGQKYEQNWAGTAATSGSYVDIGSQQTLEAGVWLVTWSNAINLGSGGSATNQHGARLVIDGVNGSTYGKDFQAGGLPAANYTGSCASGSIYVNKAASWTLKAQATAGFSGATAAYYGSWTATRIA